jgi:ribosome biogenesis GTPase
VNRPDQTLDDLGWSAFFADQVAADEGALLPRRISEVHKARLSAIGADIPLTLPHKGRTSDYAVGDWVLVEPGTELVQRRLDRFTVLERHHEGGGPTQLAAANVDTLFIVTSCDDDFSVARLERYLVFANESGTTPVIVLTKGDKADNPERYRSEAQALQRDLDVIAVNPKFDDVRPPLATWIGLGQTVAVVGSSGVGKSTLVNRLVGTDTQLTGATRESDSKGRHTTTARSMHRIPGGGWVIDTPGIRSLQVTGATVGLDTLFAEISELAPQCKFRNCTHSHEPGCAVLAALKAGEIDPSRYDRWRKLQDEIDAAATTGRPRRG